MALKLILSSVAATALLSATAFAQVSTTETDPRFMPRTYGSYAVTGADYGQGASVAQAQTPEVQTQTVISYRQNANTVRVEQPVVQDFQTVIFKLQMKITQVSLTPQRKVL